MQGKFITVEGVEGVGKSTNLTFIEKHLVSNGNDVIVTREPGGTPLAEAIRAVVLNPVGEKVPDNAELLLIFAARAVHIENLIRPALAAGQWVLCDRFTDATYAYQGAGRGLSTQAIDDLKQRVQGELEPDLTLLLDAPLETSMQRAADRNHQTGSVDRFEEENRDFFERVRNGYLDLAVRHRNRIRTVDADQPLAEVQKELASVIDSIFK